MGDKDKAITTVYIEKEIQEFIKLKKINLSDWINENFSKEFFNISSYSRKISEHYEKAEEFKIILMERKKTLLKIWNSMSNSNKNKLIDCYNKKDKFSIIGLFKANFRGVISFSDFTGLLDLFEIGDIHI